MYSEYEIRTVPLRLKSARTRVEQFLASCQLRLDAVDSYSVVYRLGEDTILAGGGLKGNTIKCVAVNDELRGTGMMQRLISHLLSEARAAGHDCVRVFTKPENRDIFKSLGFRTLATAPQAIFMENGMPGIDAYLHQLEQKRQPGKNGVIVMNANPFTLGHQALVRWAASQVDTLYVIAVSEDCSLFTATERLHMIERGCHQFSNVAVCPGSDYAISASTFPTYFLKRIDDATDTQITLDLNLFASHIARALGATIRFAGSEPVDALTARYVALMQEQLPPCGIEVRVMPRIEVDNRIVSATTVRKLLAADRFAEATALVPPSTRPTLLSYMACQALQMELDTTPKPGLVDKVDNGAHLDMNYTIMQRSISALRPALERLALMGWNDTLPQAGTVKAAGIEAETEMLKATAGVNTHRGALFSVGLTVIAASHLLRKHNLISLSRLQETITRLATHLSQSHDSHGGQAVNHYRVNGALAMAQKGYETLIHDWLPFYRSLDQDPWRCHKTLLHIMAQLDDTNVIHRVGYERAQQVKKETLALLSNFNPAALEEMNRRYIDENISPGGAADMLSLTILVAAITCDNLETT